MLSVILVNLHHTNDSVQFSDKFVLIRYFRVKPHPQMTA